MATRRTTARAKAEGEYGDVPYADEKNKKYPVDTEEHIRAAWSYIHQEKNREGYTAAELKTIEAKIVAAWKDKIDKEGPPAAAEKVADAEGTFHRAMELEVRFEPTPAQRLARTLEDPTLDLPKLLELCQRHLPNSDYTALVKAEATAETARAALTKIARAADPEDISMAISSEAPIEDPWMDGVEILDHSAAGCDLTRANQGLPLRVTESTYSHEPGEQVGILENLQIGADRVLRGSARFSRSAYAQEIKQDVQDGIRRGISVGGRRLGIMSQDRQNGALVTRTKWQPFEATICPVPADISVGVGRSAREAADPSRTRSAASAAAPTGQERTMPEDAAARAAGNGGAAGAVVENEGTEHAKIVRIAKQEGIPYEKVADWLEKGLSYEEACTVIVQERLGRQAAVTQPPIVELTDKERREYSFVRGILALADQHEGKKASGLEMDIHKDLEKAWPSSLKRNGGLLIPTFTTPETPRRIQYRQMMLRGEIERAGLDSATATAGTELKFNVPGEFLEALRHQMILARLGAELMGGLVGPIVFPFQDGVGSASWVGENPGVDVGDSNLTLSTRTLRPNTLQSSTSYSRQLLAQSSYDVDAMVRNDLARIMALEVDRAGISGSGVGSEPAGVINTAGVDVTTVAGGGNGALPSYGNLDDLETVVCEADADVFPGFGYATTPGIRGRLKQTVALGNTVGLPIWTKPDAVGAGAAAFQGGGSRQLGEVNGYAAWSSNQVPSTLDKGTSLGVCHAIVFGAWSQLVIGDWGMFELIVDPYRLKKQGMIELTTFQMVGIVLKYPAAFAGMLDALKR